MTIKEARQKIGYTQQQVSDKLEIPMRTLQDWENERRKCPPYVEKLVIEKLLSFAEETE